jgi:hypothetical protein
VFDHLLYPVCPGFEKSWRPFLVESSEDFSDRIQEGLLALINLIRWFSFDTSKNEEATQGPVWAVSLARQAFGF